MPTNVQTSSTKKWNGFLPVIATRTKRNLLLVLIFKPLLILRLASVKPPLAADTDNYTNIFQVSEASTELEL